MHPVYNYLEMPLRSMHNMWYTHTRIRNIISSTKLPMCSEVIVQLSAGLIVDHNIMHTLCGSINNNNIVDILFRRQFDSCYTRILSMIPVSTLRLAIDFYYSFFWVHEFIKLIMIMLHCWIPLLYWSTCN